MLNKNCLYSTILQKRNSFLHSRLEVEPTKPKPKPKSIQQHLNILASFLKIVVRPLTIRKWKVITTTRMTITLGTNPG